VRAKRRKRDEFGQDQLPAGSQEFVVRARERAGGRFTALETSARRATRRVPALVGPRLRKIEVLDLLGGLTAPTSGRILLDGRPIEGPARDRGLVFSAIPRCFPGVPPRKTSNSDSILLGSRRGSGADVRCNYLELVGLSAFAERYPHELSGGMKQPSRSRAVSLTIRKYC